MNQVDRERLMRLRQILASVPYPIAGGGSASASISGFVAYQNDMRNLLPAAQAILLGIVCEGREGLEEGLDYHAPGRLLDDLEAWIEKRKAEEWANITGRDFVDFAENR